MANNGPIADHDENDLQDFGADVCEELFGSPDNPCTLLWMADGIYHVTCYIKEYLTAPFTAKKPKRD